jgi:excinuclease ABC subunit C
VNIDPGELELDTRYQLVVPKIGDKRKLVDLALKNCLVLLKEKASVTRVHWTETYEDKLMRRMQEDLRLTKPPLHIECFDNSNIQGYEPVSSCVVFRGGKPSKKDYRMFKVKTVEGPDDFATMKEVVGRRYKRLLAEGQPLPDLVLIDGGKGQLSHAAEALRELGILHQVAIIGIAKRLEELYYLNDPVPLYIDKTSPTLRVLQQARNEAHRFAINFHRKRRDKATLKTGLTNIPGIGEKTSKLLLKELGSIKQVQQADFDLLQDLVGTAKAQAIQAYFASQGEAPQD